MMRALAVALLLLFAPWGSLPSPACLVPVPFHCDPPPRGRAL